MHDLQPVAIVHGDIAERRTRHDLQIALDRHLGGVEPERADERSNALARGNAARLAIDMNADLGGFGGGAGHRARLLARIEGQGQAPILAIGIAFSAGARRDSSADARC